MSASPRFFIETWGCQMNQLDSQRMAGQLMQQGLLPTRQVDQADVILLNSCSVREKAAQKAYSRLGEYRLLKRERPELRIGFCGCVAQQEGERALSRVPELDFVVGTGRVGEIARIVEHSRRSGERVVAAGFPSDRHYDIDSIARDGHYKGMVTIIEGCDKRCTFCIVPTTRGPERSRSMAEILAEVEHLVDYGFVEIELLGQTVNHWREPTARGHDAAGSRAAGSSSPGSSAAGRNSPKSDSRVTSRSQLDFADLLDAVARVPGVRRLRFVTSYPRDFSQRMVDAMARHDNICPYLHLPVQSGSDRVLRRMGRGYTAASYRDLAARLRASRPDIVLSTDIIVGFPGETEEDFLTTLALVESLRFGSIFAFKYSPRPGTAALRLHKQEVDLATADRRLQELFALQNEIQRELNEALVGRELEILVTGWSRQRGHQAGRTACHRIVHFAVDEEPDALGSLTRVRIDKANHHSLLGRRTAA